MRGPLPETRCHEPRGSECLGQRAARRPGNVESNDGLDNQCPGEDGYGAVDETSGASGFRSPSDRNELSWTRQPGATSYQVVRSTGPQFAAGCTIVTTTDTRWSDSAVPQAGQPRFYLNRPLPTRAGSFGLDSYGQERPVPCLAP